MAKRIPNIVTTPPGPEAIKWVERDKETMASYNRPFYYPLVVAGTKNGGTSILRSKMG
jgi:hypothetical protein